ncbi:helix-turn-helix transcriptional regulator [Akkermansiaceae bacterium]|nr:helix-turn-helix transcriptional regulator [Akkermansiaceae bacterium]
MPVKKRHCISSKYLLASSLDLFGDHWTLLVIRDLMILGKHEFKEFLSSPEGISTNVLTDRLSYLCSEGLVAWIEHPHSKKRKLYYLTEDGKSLFPVLSSIVAWNLRNTSVEKIPERLRLVAAGKTDEAEKLMRSALTSWEKKYLPEESANFVK